MKKLAPVVAAFLLVLLPLIASAGGLYLTEFGTPNMGVAGAGEARADDASTAIHSPAGMTRLDEHQLMLGAAVGFSTVNFDPSRNATGNQNMGSSGGEQGGFVPILSGHYVHKLSDRLRLGTSLLSFSGSVLDPENGWLGRGEITYISLFTLSVVPNLAYRVTDWLSVAGGAAVTYGRLDYDLRSPGPLGLEAKIDDADDVAAAGMASVLIEPSENLRFAVKYLSETDFDLDGDVDLSPGLSGVVDVDQPLAQFVRASAWWQATDRVALMAVLGWEDWSTAGSVPTSFNAGTVQIPLEWKDTYKIGGGIHYRASDLWTLQAGVTYDTSPVEKADRLAALPVDRQIRWAVGGLYDWSEHTRVGLAFNWIDLGRASIDNARIRGSYSRNDLFLLALNVNWKQLPWSGRGTW
ncbi:MAG: OmpP1/FadL family transporter [Myxococcota bacterium]